MSVRARKDRHPEAPNQPRPRACRGLGHTMSEVAGPARVIDGDTIEIAGERIYHVPGGAYYDRTKISPAKGERWFCTEEEAQAAGWRRSK